MFRQLILTILLLLSCSGTLLAKESSDKPDIKCPYADSKVAGTHCDKFANTNVLKFECKVKPKAHVICIHGLGLCAKAYIPFLQKLSNDGYKACSLDVIGFGANRKEDNTRVSLNETVRLIEKLLTYLRKTEPDTKLILLGESMGGAIVIAVAAERPDLIDGLICSAPAWKVYKEKRLAAKGVVDLVIAKPGPAAKSVMKQATTNKKLVKHWRKDHDHTLDLSPGEVVSFLRFISKTPKRASKIELPVLLIHGMNDRLIKPEGTAGLFKRFKSEEKCFLLLENDEHLILEEGQFDDTVVSAVENWIDCYSCPSSKDHDNAVVLVKRDRLKKKEKRYAKRIFRKAGFEKFKIKSAFDNSSNDKFVLIENQ